MTDTYLMPLGDDGAESSITAAFDGEPSEEAKANLRQMYTEMTLLNDAGLLKPYIEVKETGLE